MTFLCIILLNVKKANMNLYEKVSQERINWMKHIGWTYTTNTSSNSVLVNYTQSYWKQCEKKQSYNVNLSKNVTDLK